MHLDYFYGLEHLALLALLLAIVWFAPNTLELTRRYQPALLIFKDPGLRPEDGETRVSWQPRLAFGLLYGLAALISVVTLIMAPSQTQFLYFQF
jgi:hypothetical protein